MVRVWFLTPSALALLQGPVRLPSLVVGLELLPEELGEHLHIKETVFGKAWRWECAWPLSPV